MTNAATKPVHRWILAETLIFGAAALLHSGIVLPNYAHSAAGTAETVIAAVLAIGLAAGFAAPRWTRGVGLGVQAFALRQAR